MGEVTTNLTGGLNLDGSKYELSAEQLSYALNRCIGSREDNQYFSTSELGNEFKLTFTNSSSVPRDVKILGHATYENFIVVCGCTTYRSIIGIININDLDSGGYQDYLVTGTSDSSKINDFLNFTDSNVSYVELVIRKNYKQDIIVYLTDAVNNPKAINLTSLATNSNVDSITKVWTGTNINNFNIQFNLFNSKTPLSYVSGLNVIDGGNLICSTFQFGIRHKLSASIYTSVVNISNPIPIVDKSETVISTIYTGNVPDTVANKSVTFTINNIDTTFPYFDLVVIYYTGLNSDLKIGLIENIPTSSSLGGIINYTFDDINKITSYITINELVQQFATYDKVGNLLEKDNTLLLANLYKNTDTTNYQVIANNIKVYFKLEAKTIVDNTNVLTLGDKLLTDYGTYSAPTESSEIYKNPENAASIKTWSPDEVYSFAFVPILSDGSQGYAYHIQAANLDFSGITGLNEKLIFPTVPSDPFNNWTELGSYQSNELFPFGSTNEKLRFHVTPSMSDVDWVTNSGNNVTVKLIKLKFEIQLAGQSILDSAFNSNKIIGWKIVRQSKLTQSNKRLITTGLLLNTCYMYGSGYPDWICASPLFGGYYHNNIFAPVNADTETSFSDVAFGEDQNTSSSNNYKRLNVFISPDIIENNYNRFKGNAIKEVGYTNSSYTSGKTYSYRAGSADFNSGAIVRYDDGSISPNYSPGTTNGQGATGHAFFQIVNNISKSSINTNHTIDNQISVSYKNAITDGIQSGIKYKHYLLDSLLLYFNSDKNITRRGTSINVGQSSNGNIEFNTVNPQITVNIGALLNLNTSYYGSYSTFVYEEVAVNYLTGTLNYSLENVFNGDKFWSRYAIRNKCAWLHSNPLSGLANDPTQIDIKRVERGDGDGTKLRFGYITGVEALLYTWFLTEGNYELKHYITQSSTNNNIGTQPFFPNKSLLRNVDDTDGVMVYAPSLNYPTGYNKQYNGNKKLLSYFVKPNTVDTVSDFSTTHVYSEKQIEGDVNDYYKVFLTNNYYSLPRKTGSITRMFVRDNILFTLTKTGLWRNYYNSLTSQTTTIGQVFTGTGGAFSIPSTLLNFGENKGGLQNYTAFTITPYGVVWYDSVLKTFWIYNGGESLTDENNSLNKNINNYIKKLFKNTEYDYINTDSTINFVNNPYKLNKGVVLNYDYYYKRLLIQIYGSTPITLSFSFLTKDWVGFHSHFSSYLLNYGEVLMSINNSNNTTKLYEWYTPNSQYLTFNGLPTQDFVLEFIVNKGNKTVGGKSYIINEEYTKVFDNLVIKSDLLNATDNYQVKTFDNITVTNDKQSQNLDLKIDNSDYAYENITTGNQLVKYHNEEYRLKIPLDNSSEQKRFKDKYLRIRLKLNGSNVLNIYKFVLYYINIIFRENAR